MNTEGPGITVSPAHRYRVAAGHRWPVDVRPAPGELLSSWLHRLAHANGVPPRYFGAVLEAPGENWSVQIDRHLPEASRRLLLDHTSLSLEDLDGLSLDPDPLSPLRLPLRTLSQRAGQPKVQSCWLEFCPTCLREDETPHFRRSRTLATRVSCFRHGCRRRDRCPSCGLGLAPFKRGRLVLQQSCVFCDAHLGKLTEPASPGIRRLERLIDDLLRLHVAGHVHADRKSLPDMLAKCPVPVGMTTLTIPHLSHQLRHDFFRRLSEGQIRIESHRGGGPLNLWARLADAAANHRGLVGALTDQLAETAGLQQAYSARMPDLAALLEAKSRLLQKQQKRPLQPVRED